MSNSQAEKLGYPNGLKCRFILVYGLIGTASNVLLMLYSIFFDYDTHQTFFYASAVAAPVLGATSYFANKLQIKPASYLAISSAILGCYGSLTLQFEAFLSLLMIFVLSTLFITVNRRQMIFLFSALLTAITIKILGEIGYVSVSFIPSSDLENETVFYVTLFLFTIFVFAVILSIILNNGIEASEKLVKTSAELEETVQVKDRLLALISHDLKNPIGGMSILIKGIQQKSIPMNQEIIEMLNKTSDTASKLIENLVHWSSVKHDQTMVNKQNFGICECINESINLLQILCEQKKIKIVNECNQKAMVHADKSMLSTVFRNIFTNAIKFSREGGIIRIWTESDDHCIKTCIQDDGDGIAKKQLQVLFSQDRDHNQLPGSEDQKGSGLGLIISKEFVELNGGGIGAESEVGKGSIFWFTTPVAVEMVE